MLVNEPYYYGSAENKLNSKGQVAIPARFRPTSTEEGERKNYVLVRGEGQCIYMYTHQRFAGVKDNVKRIADETDNDGFYRTFMKDVQSVELDTQGRFVLPQILMREVGIKGPSILFIGMDDRIEIWDPAVYEGGSAASQHYEETRKKAARKIFGI